MPRKGSNWHGHYFGPGNRIDKQWRRSHRPVDSLDAAAEKHDLRYSRLQSKYGKLLPYILPSEADARFVKDIKGEKGFKAAAARVFFKAKGLIPFKLSAPMPKRARVFMPMGASKRLKLGYRKGPERQPGHYRGPLPKPKRPRRPSKYEKAGYVKEVERYGTQSLDDVCYVGCTSFCHADVGTALGIALIRKLMKRHYMFEYSDPQQAINPTVTFVGSGPVKIFWYLEEITAANVEPTISVGWTFDVGTKTLEQFASEFYTNVLTATTFGVAQNAASFPVRRLHGYRFEDADYDNNYLPYRTRSSTLYPLKDQYLTMYSSVKMGIQNSTVSDAGDRSTTVIDANPIKGKLFHFRDLLPRLRQRNGAFGTVTTDNSFKLQVDPNGDGIIKPDANITGDWTQIPTGTMFSNCNGEVSISLEPGVIKDYSINFKFNGTLEKFLAGFGAFEYPLQKGAFGTSCLFALEKRMPTGASPVVVNFHYEARFGCVFGKRLGVLMPKAGTAGTAVTNQLLI